jgi:hypothetical protein
MPASNVVEFDHANGPVHYDENERLERFLEV